MKSKLKLVAFIILSSLFTACDNDDSGNSQTDNSQSIIGKWEVIQTGLRIDGVETLNDVTPLCGGRSAIYEYKADGTFIITTSHLNEIGECAAHQSTGTWTILNNTLISVFDGVSEPFIEEILNLNDMTLKTFSSPNFNVNVLRRITGNELLLEGKWEYIQYAWTDSEDEEPQYNNYVSPCDGLSTLEFNIIGIYYEQFSDLDEYGNCQVYNHSYKWKVAGNQLHILGPTREILFLDETKLITKTEWPFSNGSNPPFYRYLYEVYNRI